MQTIGNALITIFVLTSVLDWAAYPIMYVSVLLHEIGHCLGGRLSRLERQCFITLGQGRRG